MRLKRRELLQLAGASALVGLAPVKAFAASRINYWHHFTSQSEFAGLEGIKALFDAKGLGVDVLLEAIPNSEYMAKITTGVMAGGMPNTAMVKNERVADLVAMNALTDITDMVEAWSMKGDFPQVLWDGISHEGKIYGLPGFLYLDWMYYRKDWFEEAGIAPPRTFEEFTVAAKKLTDPSKGRYGFAMRGGAGAQRHIFDVFESYGVEMVAPDGSIAFDKQAAIEGLKWYTALHTTDRVTPPSAPNDSFRQIMESFQTGQTAMLWHHTGSIRDISSALEPGVEFGTVPMPAGPKKHVARLEYAYNSILNAENAQDSFDWISTWGEADSAIAMLNATGYFPASPKVAADPRIADNPIYAAAIETLDFGKQSANFPGLPGWLESSVLPSFQRILVGESSVEDAVEEMAIGLEQVIG